MAFYFNINLVKQPALFYNGFCDQEYWNLLDRKVKYDKSISYHPILAIKKDKVFIPDKFDNNARVTITDFNKKNIALYGSSFMDHKDFQILLDNNKEFKFLNYSLGSYGLDQIYLSYKLTAHLNQNSLLVFGFLLEDLDRSLFNKRDYNKPMFKFENDNFKLTNVPIQTNVNKNKTYDFYLFRFLSNFIELSKNNFDSRLSRCHVDKKKKLFEFFINSTLKETKKYNQKIIIITFNLIEDITNKESWRYEYVKNFLKQKNIIHIDSLEILKNNIDLNSENPNSYYGKDLHNNRKSFNYIYNKFLESYKAM